VIKFVNPAKIVEIDNGHFIASRINKSFPYSRKWPTGRTCNVRNVETGAPFSAFCLVDPDLLGA